MTGAMLVTLLFAALFALVWPLSGSWAKGRTRLRALYQDDAYPAAFRSAIPLAPLWAAVTFLFGLLWLFPRSFAQIAILPLLDLVVAVFALGYKVPPPIAPRWLKAELESGTISTPQPTRGDWVLLWAIILVAAAGNVGIIWLLVRDA